MFFVTINTNIQLLYNSTLIAHQQNKFTCMALIKGYINRDVKFLLPLSVNICMSDKVCVLIISIPKETLMGD